MKITIQLKGYIYSFESEGGNLFDILIKKGIFLASDCGEKGECGKCSVVLQEGTLLVNNEIVDGKVKACQATVISDINIVVEDALVFLKQKSNQITINPCNKECSSCKLNCKDRKS